MSRPRALPCQKPASKVLAPEWTLLRILFLRMVGISIIQTFLPVVKLFWPPPAKRLEAGHFAQIKNAWNWVE